MVEATPRATQRVKRPRVLGMVIVLIIRALLGLFVGSGFVVLVSLKPDTPFWVTLLVYLTFAMGIGNLVAAVLTRMYRRIGLYLCVFLVGLDLFLRVLEYFVGGEPPKSLGIGEISMSLYVGYYAYQYLTHEPEKSFFR